MKREDLVTWLMRVRYHALPTECCETCGHMVIKYHAKKRLCKLCPRFAIFRACGHCDLYAAPEPKAENP